MAYDKPTAYAAGFLLYVLFFAGVYTGHVAGLDHFWVELQVS
jgi:hypothetical protein